MPSDGSVKVWSYTEALENAEALGNKVVILGSGGIAMDTASKLAQHSESIEDYEAYWGIDSSLNERGALVKPAAREALRKVTIVQRNAKKLGQQLGKTTVWSHRTELQQLGVKVVSGIENLHVSEGKVQFNVGGNLQQVEATDLVLCIGQTSEQPLGDSAELVVLGGARDAARLDAKRVIYETTKWAISY
jgi:2,4-dienoyl-CoA reductase (NADPH2)